MDQAKSAMQYVGFWRRFMAAIIDSIALLIVIVPVLLAVYGWGYLSNDAMFKGSVDFLMQMIFPLVVTILLWIKFGATPGKMLLDVKVVDAESGAPITAKQAILRYLGYYVSLLPLGLGIFWVAVDARKQGFHDKIAGTVVVRSVPQAHHFADDPRS